MLLTKVIQGELSIIPGGTLLFSVSYSSVEDIHCSFCPFVPPFYLYVHEGI